MAATISISLICFFILCSFFVVLVLFVSLVRFTKVHPTTPWSGKYRDARTFPRGSLHELRSPDRMKSDRTPFTPSLSPCDGERVSEGQVKGIFRRQNLLRASGRVREGAEQRAMGTDFLRVQCLLQPFGGARINRIRKALRSDQGIQHFQ